VLWILAKSVSIGPNTVENCVLLLCYTLHGPLRSPTADTNFPESFEGALWPGRKSVPCGPQCRYFRHGCWPFSALKNNLTSFIKALQ
jgi:hypothetical protein